MAVLIWQKEVYQKWLTSLPRMIWLGNDEAMAKLTTVYQVLHKIILSFSDVDSASWAFLYKIVIKLPIFDSSTYYNLHCRSWKSNWKGNGQGYCSGYQSYAPQGLQQQKIVCTWSHDCRANWGGSSKGMESDLAVEMLNTKKDDTFQVSTLIGDDDSTTMAMVRQKVNHQVEKWSDVNHAKKSLGTVALSWTKW